MSITTLPSFKVGQVIFLIPKGERRVMPAQVTEEILRRSISGEETVWMIQLVGSQKSVPLDPDAAEYFTDINDLRHVLTQRTVEQLNLMIDRTYEVAMEAFSMPTESVSQSDDSDILTITLPDGTKAKVRSK